MTNVRRRRERHIPVGAAERDYLVFGERLLKGLAELTPRAGYDDASASRGDRIGNWVLQR